jgi:hypothetical protein
MAMRVSMMTVVGLLVVVFAFWSGDAEAQRGRGRGGAAPAHPLGGARPGVGKTHPQQPKAKAHQKSKGPASKGAQKKQKGSPQEKGKAKKEIADKKGAGKKAGDRHEAPAGKAKVREGAKEAKSKTQAKAQQVGKAAPGTRPTSGTPTAAPGAAPTDGASAAVASTGPADGAVATTASIGPSAGASATAKVVPAAGMHDVSAQPNIFLLQAARQKLQEVSRGYGGHKLRAEQHVGAALGHLRSPAPPSIATGNAQANMPRPVSDDVLREARTSLQKVARQLPAGARDGEARAALNEAIRELNLALNSR